MADSVSIKAAARKQAFAQRKVAHAQGLDAAACKNLTEFLSSFVDATIVAGYMPIRTEVSPLPVMTALEERGLRICVPVIQGEGQALKFREWTPNGVMVDGPFGASVPAHGDELDPQVLIAPLVAFDARGYRLGYGGGFYDRSLEGLRKRRRTWAIGFAYSGQELDVVPTERTDQKLDAVVTETGARQFA